jgi:cytochrome P450
MRDAIVVAGRAKCSRFFERCRKNISAKPKGSTMLSPLDSKFSASADSQFSQLRQVNSVIHVPDLNAYFVLGHSEVIEVLSDVATYSNKRDNLGVANPPELQAELDAIRADGWPHCPVIADQDPPLHEAFRAVVAPFFTPSFLRRFTDGFVDICHALVDAWSARSEVAFVREFAEPLPIRAITRIFDLPVIDEVEQETRFARWRDAATISVGSEVERNQLLEAEREICEMQRYFFSHISAANEKDSSLFAALKFGVVDLSDGSRRPLTDAERLTIMRQLFVGGVETTTKALSEAMLHLSAEPEMFSALASDADLCRRVVEESLRLSAPAQGILRTTTRATRLGGIDIDPGSRLFVIFASANRDEKVIPEALRFNPHRKGVSQHLSFGRGIHTCLGAPLARLELQIALRVLSERVRDFQAPPLETLAYHPSFILRGLVELPLKVRYR